MENRNSLKKLSFINNTNKTMGKLTADRPLLQKKIFQKILRYNAKRYIHYSEAYKNSKGKDAEYIGIEKKLEMGDRHLGFG